jgi:hypothetical protein
VQIFSSKPSILGIGLLFVATRDSLPLNLEAVLMTTQKIYQMRMMDVNEENDGITIVLHFNFRCEFKMGPALCEEDILRE